MRGLTSFVQIRSVCAIIIIVNVNLTLMRSVSSFPSLPDREFEMNFISDWTEYEMSASLSLQTWLISYVCFGDCCDLSCRKGKIRYVDDRFFYTAISQSEVFKRQRFVTFEKQGRRYFSFHRPKDGRYFRSMSFSIEKCVTTVSSIRL